MPNYILFMTLIPAQRAIDLVPQFDVNDNPLMDAIVTACSDLIELYLNRTFAVTGYDELIDGSGHFNLLVTNYPVTQIERIMFNLAQVIQIGNVSSSVSRASFRLDATNLYLTAVVNGVVTNRTIARSSCVTLANLATAINAYSADGWQSLALGLYSSWLLADLYSPQGGTEVRWSGMGYLWHHTMGISAYLQNPRIGELVSSFGFVRGYQNYRVIYSAGFSTAPTPIQQACAELAAACYLNREINPNLQSESLGDVSYTQLAEKNFAALSIASKYALDQYRSFRVSKFKVY